MRVRVEVIERGPWLSLGPIRRAERVRVTISSLAAGPARPVRLLHLTDWHFTSRPHPVFEQIIARTATDPPEAVLVTGDFVDNKLDPRRALPALEATLPRLRSRWGTFAVLGNHDGDLLAGHLPRLGVRLLEGERARVGEPGAGQIDLVGLPGVTRTEPPGLYDQSRDPAVATVALSHYPDVVRRLGRLRPDIVLAGHTHGGQVCLPGRFPIITHDSLPRLMAAGVHETENGLLIVSRGLGHTGVPFRLFTPPQVVEVVIGPEAEGPEVGS